MSIASAIQTKQQQVADSYTVVSNKGGTLPATQNLTYLAIAISSIPSGTTPTGTLSITANGVYDVTNYASADVSVSGGGDSVYMYFYMQDPMLGAASIDNPIKVGSKCYVVDGYAETGIDFSSPMTVISVGTYSFNTDDGGIFPKSYSNLYQLR